MTIRSSLYYRRGSGGKVAIEDMSASTGKRWFVDSTNSACSDATTHGFTPDKPLATLDYAVGLCTADAGDIIYLMPGHNEGGTAVIADIDVAGVSVIGIGTGAKRPRFDFDHANATIDIGANNVTIRNVTFLPSVAIVSKGLDVETDVTDFRIENCEFLDGEASGTDEFVIGIALTAGNTRAVIRNNIFRLADAADGAICFVKLDDACTNVIIEDNVFYGPMSTAAEACIFGDTGASTKLLIRRNIMWTDAEPCIKLLTGSTGVIADNYCATDLATKAAAIEADGAFLFENYYCEVATETGGIIGTASADD